MMAVVPVMADPAEFCWLAANVVLVAVLIMMIARWWRPNRSSSPTCTGATRSVGGSAAAAFETRAKELETAGDLDGAMRTLLAFWTDKGSSTAMTLAHELSQRHPEEAFEKGCGCPLQQEGNRGRVLGLAVSASAATGGPCPATTDAADADTTADAAGTATAPHSAVAVPATAACNISVFVGAVGADSVSAPAEKVTGGNDKTRGRSPVAAQDTPPVVRSHGDGDDSSGHIDRKPQAVAVTEALLGSNNGDNNSGGGDGETSSTTETMETTTSTSTAAAATATTTLPWERGWQGPKGFKPPSTAIASSSSSSISNKIDTFVGAGGTTAVAVEHASSSGNSVSAPVEAAAGGGRGLAGEKAMRRNFTVLQLNTFDGSVPAPKVRGGEIKAGKARPIYIALRGEVYDASAGRNLYGPGGEYSEFAGHDISRRVARGVSRSRVDVSDTNSSNALLDDLSLEGFDRFEKMTLRGWEDTFKARGYPRLGRVVAPPPPRFFSRAELRAFDGRPAAAEEGGEEGEDRDVGGEGLGGQASEGAGAARGGGKAGGQTALGSRQEKVSSLPANYAAQPIYLGVKDKVFDVSFGGSEFYLEGGAYQCLAGRDASRVLAKMSMTPEDIEGVLDYACLTSREEKNLGDWVEKLGSGGKGYPVVGWIDIGL